jgi:hypothetical protein
MCESRIPREARMPGGGFWFQGGAVHVRCLRLGNRSGHCADLVRRLWRSKSRSDLWPTCSWASSPSPGLTAGAFSCLGIPDVSARRYIGGSQPRLSQNSHDLFLTGDRARPVRGLETPAPDAPRLGRTRLVQSSRRLPCPLRPILVAPVTFLWLFDQELPACASNDRMRHCRRSRLHWRHAAVIQIARGRQQGAFTPLAVQEGKRR